MTDESRLELFEFSGTTASFCEHVPSNELILPYRQFAWYSIKTKLFVLMWVIAVLFWEESSMVLWRQEIYQMITSQQGMMRERESEQ